MRRIWGGFWREASQVLMSFCLFESFPSPLTLKETIVRGRSDMAWVRLGSGLADRSHVVESGGLLVSLSGVFLGL